jgi:hypothetical protein
MSVIGILQQLQLRIAGENAILRDKGRVTFR